MRSKKIIALAIGIFLIILLAGYGVFSGIIKSFSEAMGFYGVLAGILIVLMIILGLLGAGRRRK